MMWYRILLLIVLFCNGLCSANANTAVAHTKGIHIAISEVKAQFLPPTVIYRADIYCGYDENEEDEDSFQSTKKSSPNALAATPFYHRFDVAICSKHDKAYNAFQIPFPSPIQLFVLYRSLLI